jgi:uncharacterized protein (TIGR00725 family)
MSQAALSGKARCGGAAVRIAGRRLVPRRSPPAAATLAIMPRRSLIAVVGDGTVAPASVHWCAAEELGKALVDAGYRLLTGGLGGVMEAACRGARQAQGYREGDTLAVLPGHLASAANAYRDIVLPTGMDNARNILIAHADAVVAMGGGAGTLSEIALAWVHRRLVIAFRLPGWSGRLADAPLDDRPRFDDIPDDRVFGVGTADEVIALLGERLHGYIAGA